MHAVYKMNLCILKTQRRSSLSSKSFILHSPFLLSSFLLILRLTKCISKRLSDCFRLSLPFSIFRNNLVNSYCVYNTKNLKSKNLCICIHPPPLLQVIVILLAHLRDQQVISEQFKAISFSFRSLKPFLL